MNRRHALKKLGLGTGMVVVTPTLINFLQSCSNEPTWQPLFLTSEQGLVLKAIADTILPRTDTPSASELNVPQFIDTYIFEVTEPKEQKKIKTAFSALINIVKSDYNENINEISEEQYQSLLDKNMLLKEPSIKPDESMSVSGLLNTIKWMTINAYRISEFIGETVLAYDPVPGSQKGCISLEEATGGKAWAL